jgi:hypothetical protein
MTQTNVNGGDDKARRLSDAALVLLSHAANRADGMLLPRPASVRARGGALEKVLAKLLRLDFVEEVPVAAAGHACRTDEDGARLGLRITRAGLEAIGVGTGDEGLDPAEDTAAEPARGALSDEARAAGAPEQGAAVSSRANPTRDASREGDQGGQQIAAQGAPGIRPASKQALLLGELRRPSGASVAELVRLLGWQPHTVRAAITGLRQKGHAISRSKGEAGETVYRAEAASAPAELPARAA